MKSKPFIVIAAILISGQVFGLAPMLRPTAYEDITSGDPAPFAGNWSMTLPTMEMGQPDAAIATCDHPVRIEAVDHQHIFYFGPNQSDAEPAIALSRREDGTHWEPIAGGPTYFTLWVSADSFFLYDEMPEAEPDWGRPFIYRRCP